MPSLSHSSASPVLITGASSGIGRATAQVMASAGIPVVGGVRNQRDADSFVTEVGPLAKAAVFDVTSVGDLRAAVDQVSSFTGRRGISGLINCASLPLTGPLEYVAISEFRGMLEVGVTGVLAVTQAFLPLLRVGRQQGRARIVNLSGLFGEIVLPFLAPYSVVKFGVEAISDGLRRELAVHGIDVVIIQPSATRTRLWEHLDRDGSVEAQDPYAESLTAFRQLMDVEIRHGIRPEIVAKLILKAFRARRPRARYRVSGRPILHASLRLLPSWALDRILATRLAIRRAPSNPIA